MRYNRFLVIGLFVLSLLLYGCIDQLVQQKYICQDSGISVNSPEECNKLSVPSPSITQPVATVTSTSPSPFSSPLSSPFLSPTPTLTCIRSNVSAKFGIYNPQGNLLESVEVPGSPTEEWNNYSMGGWPWDAQLKISVVSNNAVCDASCSPSEPKNISVEYYQAGSLFAKQDYAQPGDEVFAPNGYKIVLEDILITCNNEQQGAVSPKSSA